MLPIGGLETEAALFLIDDGLHVGGFAARVGHGGWPQLGEQFIYHVD